MNLDFLFEEKDKEGVLYFEGEDFFGLFCEQSLSVDEIISKIEDSFKIMRNDKEAHDLSEMGLEDYCEMIQQY